jgi:crotonobetainyl-CoA:carnitine CoA-transferase CaiB-like acyl-CoA transferase
LAGFLLPDSSTVSLVRLARFFQSETMAAPLNNLRILDMSRVLAGPWAGQLLGDFGADVIKIERPLCGDDTRSWGPPWLQGNAPESGYFLSANRNKRSVTVDIATPDGQTIIHDLAKQSDVLLENFKAGTMARFGLGPETLLELNPELIYCSISAYGQASSRADEPGYDAMIQASAGLMSITGPAPNEPGGPQKVGVAISDIMAGMYATTAILAAVNARTLSGRGQHIDIPLYDSQVAWLANQNMNYLLSASDARFTTMRQRIANRDELIGQMEIKFRDRDTQDWLELLVSRGVPAGPVNDIGEVLTDSYAQQKGLVREIRNGNDVRVPTVANPVSFSETPVCYEKAPPLLGEHTVEVLQERLGYSDAKIETLRNEKVI